LLIEDVTLVRAEALHANVRWRGAWGVTTSGAPYAASVGRGFFQARFMN
jgi:hypothetical protein